MGESLGRGGGFVGVSVGVGRLAGNATVGARVLNEGTDPQAAESKPMDRRSPIAPKKEAVRTCKGLFFIFRGIVGFSVNDIALTVLLRDIPPGSGNDFLQRIGVLLDDLFRAKSHE